MFVMRVQIFQMDPFSSLLAVTFRLSHSYIQGGVESSFENRALLSHHVKTCTLHCI